jgi:hypothetical protein
VAFTGDTAGGRIGTAPFVMPPTPPPDIDLEAWDASARVILDWKPGTLFLTHFGPSPTDPASHLAELMDRLRRSADLAKQAAHGGGSEAEQIDRFRDQWRRLLRQHMSEPEAIACELAIPLDHCFLGLARYWKKKATPAV